jgi:hypothetical protein
LIKDLTNKVGLLGSSNKSHVPVAMPTGEIDTNAVMTFIKKLQVEMQSKAELKDVENIKVQLNQKADKSETLKE